MSLQSSPAISWLGQARQSPATTEYCPDRSIFSRIPPKGFVAHSTVASITSVRPLPPASQRPRKLPVFLQPVAAPGTPPDGYVAVRHQKKNPAPLESRFLRRRRTFSVECHRVIPPTREKSGRVIARTWIEVHSLNLRETPDSGTRPTWVH